MGYNVYAEKLSKLTIDCATVYTQFGHGLPTGKGESPALNSAAHSANFSISCGHTMAELGSSFLILKG